jgi:hypothetical protein
MKQSALRLLKVNTYRVYYFHYSNILTAENKGKGKAFPLQAYVAQRVLGG